MAPSGSAPIDRRSMSAEAFTYLRDAIVTGELSPGEPLQDFKIAEILGTSKMPVRHALSRLREQGLVEIQRNRYSRVAPIEPHQVENAVRALGDVWAGAARRLGTALEKDRGLALRGRASILESAASSRRLTEFATALFSLATAYARIEDNPLRQSVIDQLAALVSRSWLASPGSFNWPAAQILAAGISRAVETSDQDMCVDTILDFVDTIAPEIVVS